MVVHMNVAGIVFDYEVSGEYIYNGTEHERLVYRKILSRDISGIVGEN